jgi:hypothetical protein
MIDRIKKNIGTVISVSKVISVEVNVEETKYYMSLSRHQNQDERMTNDSKHIF